MEDNSADIILKKRRAGFCGFESIDSAGKRHFHPFINEGKGSLVLTRDNVSFNKWLTQKEYIIPVDKISKVEIKRWHNLKMRWPGRVLRIFFSDGEDTKILGVFMVWQKDASLWRDKIESMIRR